MTLGESITRLRTQKGWSQGDLADALDVSRQSISKWETDTSVPELEKLLRLSELFGVTLDALVRGEQAETQTENAAHAAPPQSAPTSPAPAVSHTHTVAGVILLCFGAAVFLLLLLLGGGLASLFYAAPFLLCALVCFTAKRHVGLWCGWAVFISLDLYLRYATGLSWSQVFLTFRWEASWNYVRLAVAWAQFLGMLAMLLCTLRAYRALRLPVTKKRLDLLAGGWVIALAALPLLMDYAILPPLRELWPSGSRFSLAFPVSLLYSYARLALITVLLVRSFAAWRTWREEKKGSQ